MPAKRLMLVSLAMCVALAAAVAGAQAPIKFDVVSVKPAEPRGWRSNFTPTGYIAQACTLRWILMQDAFAIYDAKRIYGGPSWLDTDRFTIEARVADADANAFNQLTTDQRRQMLRAVLEDRFHLVFHHETKEFPAYDLTVAKAGLKMSTSKPDEINIAPDGTIRAHVTASKPGVFEVQATTMELLAQTLSRDPDIGRIVIDKTGLTGRYNYALHFTPENTRADSPIAGGPNVFTALEEQLGVKLVPSKASIEVTIIDTADHPSPN
jgi:uncharacterized protein (TIGR03435 family)